MLSKGVTASSDSVTPAPKPAATVLGPDSLPSASTRRFLYVSNATNRTPALIELPMMSVVHPAYHSLEGNLGNGSFCESGSLWFSCDLVFANSKGYVIEISIAPAVEPAMIERKMLGYYGQLFSTTCDKKVPLP